MTDQRVPSPLFTTPMGRRAFLGRTAAAGVVAWSVPSVISTAPVAAAAGSCNVVSIFEFTGGLDGWTIDNSWGSGRNGLWKHDTQASRDGGSLHYGHGRGRHYKTGNSRNSGRVYSPQFVIPSSGGNTVKFSVWREVETRDVGYDQFRLLILGNTTQTLYSVASIGNTSGFENHTISIPSAFSGQTVRFQFDFDTRDGLYNKHEGIYVGRFEVTACPPAGAGAAPSFAPARAAASGQSVGDESDVPPPRR